MKKQTVKLTKEQEIQAVLLLQAFKYYRDLKKKNNEPISEEEQNDDLEILNQHLKLKKTIKETHEESQARR